MAHQRVRGSAAASLFQVAWSARKPRVLTGPANALLLPVHRWRVVARRRNGDYPGGTLAANVLHVLHVLYLREKIELLFPSYEVRSRVRTGRATQAAAGSRQAAWLCPSDLEWPHAPPPPLLLLLLLQIYWPLSLLVFRLNQRMADQVEAFQHLRHWNAYHVIGLQVRCPPSRPRGAAAAVTPPMCGGLRGRSGARRYGRARRW